MVGNAVGTHPGTVVWGTSRPPALDARYTERICHTFDEHRKLWFRSFTKSFCITIRDYGRNEAGKLLLFRRNYAADTSLVRWLWTAARRVSVPIYIQYIYTEVGTMVHVIHIFTIERRKKKISSVLIRLLPCSGKLYYHDVTV